MRTDRYEEVKSLFAILRTRLKTFQDTIPLTLGNIRLRPTDDD